MDMKQFLMSKKFNKTSPQDFGLVQDEKSGLFIMTTDNSLWKRRDLYDFGWGKEYGFYRIPLPKKLDELIDIIMNTRFEENKYGAAAVILDDFCEELLIKSWDIFRNNNQFKYIELFKILKLDSPFNRSGVLGKNVEQITSEYLQWVELAQKVKKLFGERKRGR